MPSMADATAVHWTVFAIAIMTMLIVDLLIAGRGSRAPNLRHAASWSAVWIGCGLLFGAWLAVTLGPGTGVTYITAYLIEESLSVDSLAVIALVFTQLQIPAARQRRVLFCGIFGALLMRGGMIAGGIYLIERFHWIMYPFALLLLFGAARVLWGKQIERRFVERSCAACSTWVARFISVTPVIRGDRLWIREHGRTVATPLLVALIVIETSDLIFALDSIPAVLAVTRNPFLVYSSNAFALLGMRSLYFLVAGALERLRFLQEALAAILIFVAAKMLLRDAVNIPSAASLLVILWILTVAILASWFAPAKPVRSTG